MTLIKCTIRRILFATIIFMLVGSVLSARGKLTLEGQVVDEDGEKVKKAELTLRKDGDVVEEDKTKGNGKFKFKKLEEGDYVLEVSHKDFGSAEKAFTLSENYDMGEVSLSKEAAASPVVATNSTTGEASMSNEAPAAVSTATPVFAILFTIV